LSSILRGGRITRTRDDVVRFISSIQDDRRIAHSTVLVNEAHVIALAEAKVIARSDAGKLLSALKRLEKRIRFPQRVEDVHVLIEEYVTRETGPQVGGLLHIGKSRNDQVATAIRMTLREEMLNISDCLLSLERVILQLAGKHLTSLFPGYTHLQPAQPITFAHYLVSMGDSILRDNQRIVQTLSRINESPMGGGALAGTSFKIDRGLEAKLLGFQGLAENSLDAVGSRDFILETLSVLSIIATNLSRLAQDIIYYSCADVGLIEIPDEFTSTSSIMPHKKNPDPIELLRGKCACVVGNYFSAANAMHGLPSGYNLDFQEITPLAWESLDSLESCLEILIQLVPKLKLNSSAIANRLELTTTTEVANILVRREGLSFRAAHKAVGQAVRTTLAKNVALKDLTSEDWKAAIGKPMNSATMISIGKALDPKQSIFAYKTIGSPNPRRVKQMIRRRLRLVQFEQKSNRRAVAELTRSYNRLGAYRLPS
jgi:argininosuccinate lyase